MDVEVIKEKELKYHLFDRLKKIGEVVKTGDLLLSGNVFRDPVQKILVNFDNADWFSSIIVPMIELNAIDCERIAPGSGKIFLDLVISDLSDYIRKSSLFNIEDDKIMKALKTIDIYSHELCMKEDYEQFMSNTLGRTALSIVREAIGQFCAGDQVTVEKSVLRQTKIEKKFGYIFDSVTFNSAFCGSTGWKRNNVNVIMVDGIIESVGEIYHLLEKANQNKESYLVICSGILPEPMNVIQTNFARKTIDLVVGVVNSNEFNIQTMTDIGTCCLVEPISALKGETISQVSNREMVKVDKVTIYPNKMTIENKSAKQATDSLLQEVIKKSESNTDISYLYQNRIKSLSSSTVKISIGRDDVDKDKNVIEEVDLFFRTSPSAIMWGFIKKSELKELPSEILCLLFGSSNVQPTRRIKKSLETYLSFRAQVNRTGTAIIKTREI